VHALVFVLDDTREQLSTVIEEIILCVRLDPRGTEPWPDESPPTSMPGSPSMLR